jgi:hypothetical protein
VIKFDRAVHKITPDFTKKAKSKTDSINEAHALKTDVRNGLLQETELRQRWDQFKDKSDTDQSIIKAKLVCISELYVCDLENRTMLIREVIKHADDWVGEYYKKAIRKRRFDFPPIVRGFDDNLVPLIRKLRADKNDEEITSVKRAFDSFKKATTQDLHKLWH